MRLWTRGVENIFGHEAFDKICEGDAIHWPEISLKKNFVDFKCLG